MAIKIEIIGRFRLVFLIANIFYFVSSLPAQTPSVDSLRSVILAEEDSLEHLNKIQKRLTLSFDVLNAKIFEQKKNLATSSNPLVRLRLGSNLRESESLAAKLDKLQKRMQSMRRQLRGDYRKILAGADGAVRQIMVGIYNKKNSRSQLAALNVARSLENEKKTWQKKLNELTPSVFQEPQLEIEPSDNIERLQLKMKLLQDRIKQANRVIIKLNKRREEFRSDLQIYDDMLNFIDNLRQNIDLEQDYFDQEHSDQLKEDLRATKSEISAITKHLQELKKDRTAMEAKLLQFKSYLKKKLSYN